MSHLLVLGATGGTGRHLVDQALAAGHTVTALVRDPQRLPARPGLRLVRGDATDAARLDEVVPGHDAVLCAVGAPARDAGRVRERSAAALVPAMQRAGVRRLIVLSSYGVAETRAHLPWIMRWLVVPLYLGRAFADHEAQEQVVRDSGLDWTLVRPPHLHDGPRRDRTRVDFAPDDPTVQPKLSRADVAAFLLAQLDDRTHLREARAIAS
ncbi:MAG: SDR family oxidoreductase [Myxococcota bacterium]